MSLRTVFSKINQQGKKKFNFEDSLNNSMALIVPFVIGAIVIALLGHSPVEAYTELFKGAFIGNLSFGTTLEKFVPILTIATAFALSRHVGYFNLGLEGSLYTGALAAAVLGYKITGLPWYLHIPLCFLAAMIVGAVWASAAGSLRAFYNVNEACSTLLLNYVAIFLTSFLCNYVWTARSSAPQTPTIVKSADLLKFLRPSRANISIFLAIGVFLIIYWMLFKSSIGYKIRTTGLTPLFTDYIGVNSKLTVLFTVMLSGAIAGLAGSFEILGLYGSFIDEFAIGLASDGMLAALISRIDFKKIPFYSFFLAALKAGSLGMERNTGVPKALVDAIFAMLILLVAMDGLFNIKLSNLFKKSDTVKSQMEMGGK